LPDRYLRTLLWSRYFQFCWRYGVFRKPVKYTSTRVFTKLPVLGRHFTTSFLPIEFSRHFFAKQLLLGRYQNAEVVLLCDSRDVVFQDDPFAYLKTDLAGGVEDCKLKECSHTGQRVKDIYDDGLTLIGDHQVVCAGVTIGTRDAILTYLEAMCNEISKKVARSAFSCNGDQAIHNWIIRTQDHDISLIPTGHKLIATLNYADLETYYELDEELGLLNKELEPVAIVHQYDRIDAIRKWCLKKWTGWA
jgi:acetyltransferase-like isoleucine patch superfamily enzyme